MGEFNTEFNLNMLLIIKKYDEKKIRKSSLEHNYVCVEKDSTIFLKIAWLQYVNTYVLIYIGN